MAWLAWGQLMDRRSIYSGGRSTTDRNGRRIRIVMHNVLFDNSTPDLCANQLLGNDADVLVIVESTQAFVSKIDDHGGRVSFPHRVSNDLSVVNEYAVRYA
jgi:hypothetical protein